MPQGQYSEADVQQAPATAQHGQYSEADVLPEQSFTAGAKEYGRKMNPVSMAEGISQNVYHPIEAIKRWGDVNNRLLSNAEDAAKRGDYTEAAAHALHYVLNGIPGLGEALDEAGTKMREGDITGGLADTAALGTQIIVGAKAPAIGRGIGTAGQYTAAAAKTAAPGVLGGMAKAGAGEVLAKLPGMELPARFGLQYPALRQVAKAIEKGHEAGMKAIAPKGAAPAAAEAATGATPPRPARAPEAPAATAPTPSATEEPTTAPGKTAADLINEEMGTKEAPPAATAKDPGQALAESHGETWSKLSQEDKLAYAQMETAQATAEARNAAAPSAYTPRPPEHYGVKPAEAPPQPAPSAPAPTPATAAPPANVHPIRTPEPESFPSGNMRETPGNQPKPASRAQTAASQAKADRFVEAIRRFNADNPQQALSAEELAAAGDEEKSMLTRGLKQGGYIKNSEKFPDTSFPYILSKLKDAEAAAQQTIKPPAGFGLGAMKGGPSNGIVPSGVSNAKSAMEPAAATEGPAVPGTSAPSPRPVTGGEQTQILIPGEDRTLQARYEVRELGDVQPSHNGQTFSPNERYALHNERDYSQPENQQRVIQNSSEERFNPRYHITDNPDATNGPIVVDERGNALGGNSRAMILQRVYGANKAGAQSYRSLLENRAQSFGIDPATVQGMKQPVLVRVVPDQELQSLPGGSAWAVRKTNVSGTAALSATERSLADAGQLSPDSMGHIAAAIEEAGPDATLNDALTGKSGTRIVNRLINDGFFSEQERPALMDGKTGALTQVAKDRISKALLGGFFKDSDQLARTAPAIRAKLERIAAPLAKVAGDPNWNLTPTVKEAVDLLEYAQAHGIKHLPDVTSQTGLFGTQEWSPEAVKMAESLQSAKPNELVAAARRYAADKEPTMFGETSPAESFAMHFH